MNSEGRVNLLTAAFVVLVVISSAAAIPTAFAATNAAAPGDMTGSGTEADPYVVTDVTQLQAMNQNLDAHYVLSNDIDASDTETWNGGNGFDSIGDANTPFSGSFDGQSYVVSNLTIDRNVNYVGPFGHVTGTISNVGFTNVDIAGAGVVGGITGYNDGGTVSESYATGSVSGGTYVGGITGIDDGTVNKSYATGTVSGNY